MQKLVKTIKEQENRLFEEWSKVRNNISRDGIIEEESYLVSNPKLMFLLKEVNSEEGFDLTEFLRVGARTQTWDNISRWIFGIRNIDREIPWYEIEAIKNKERRKDLLKSTSFINIKKSPGGHTTNNGDLWKIANEDKVFLQRQINIYLKSVETCPKYVIACGTITGNYFSALVGLENASDWEYTTRGIPFYRFGNGSVFIRYAHPEARIPDNLLYYGLVDAIKELSTA